MANQIAPVYGFGKQLQTRGSEDFGSPDAFRIFANGRTSDGLMRRRPGKARVAVCGTDHGALNFAPGSSEILTIPLPTGGGVWVLPLRFTLEIVFKGDDDPTGNEYLLGYAGAGVGGLTLRLNSSRNMVAVWTDSAAASVTMTSSTALTSGTAYSVLVTRDTSTLKLWVNNTAEATSTSASATLLGATPTASVTVAGNNGTDFFDGDIDHLTLLQSCLTDNAEGFLRLADPLADDVLAHYTMEQTANAHVTDWSRYGNTAIAANTPTTATALCVQDALVQGVAPMTTLGGQKRAVVVAGGRVYGTDLT